MTTAGLERRRQKRSLVAQITLVLPTWIETDQLEHGQGLAVRKRPGCRGSDVVHVSHQRTKGGGPTGGNRHGGRRGNEVVAVPPGAVVAVAMLAGQDRGEVPDDLEQTEP